jgi:tetrahydromethanopterin S-methyltransferase subunit G
VRSSNSKVVFLQKKFNKKTNEWNQIIQFLDEMNKSVELIYSYKKINSLLRDIYVFPEEMKIIIERYIYEIRYSEKIKEWYLITKFYSFHSVPSFYIAPYKYSSLDELLEDIKNKLQEGLNELPELLPYYKDKKYTLRLKMYV